MRQLPLADPGRPDVRSPWRYLWWIVTSQRAAVLEQASDATLRSALDAVDALDRVECLPDGLDTRVGSGGLALTPAQAQQVALARLVLDEATSLIDPRAARHLERSLGAVLAGRTVVAIAHRLHTAHDADRVAVVEDGVIAEIGSHDELVASGGSYAALWSSWHGHGGHLTTTSSADSTGSADEVGQPARVGSPS